MTTTTDRKLHIALIPIALAVAALLWHFDGNSEPENLRLSGQEAKPAAGQVATAPDPTAAEPQPEVEQPVPAALSESSSVAGDPPLPVESDQPRKPASEAWDGSWLTLAASKATDMSRLAADAPDYDAKTEAQQLFHPFEQDLRATDPLEPDSYRALLGKHKQQNARALSRSMELRKAGYEEQGQILFKEWSRLFELYRKKAYGKAPAEEL